MASAVQAGRYNQGMNLDPDICYRALSARDVRFDGLFFVGVKSTGIYCRSVCTAKTPGRSRCRFFERAALAEQAGFRPCLRCRPELAPGEALLSNAHSIARAAAARIEAGALQEGANLETLAENLGVSSRQLRRSVRSELGVSPVELAQTNRLLLAKRLIAETELPMVQVAFAAGFQSVRRFNALFRKHYRLTPSALRRVAKGKTSADHLQLTLMYRPPLDWQALLTFLKARAIPGVEIVQADAYCRTVNINEHHGWLRVSPMANRNALQVDVATELATTLPAILKRLRNLLDLDARPDVIASDLSRDPFLKARVKENPGLRVPGAFDSFELSLRAVLGQQVSVRGATTLAGRFAETFGEAIETPIAGLTRLTPTAAVLAAAKSSALSAIGLPKARGESLHHLADVVSRGELDLEPGVDPMAATVKLVELPGIGPWTAQYIAMRALRSPDAFPTGDLGLMKSLGMTSAKKLEERAEGWRPWRAYAAMHLWESLKVK